MKRFLTLVSLVLLSFLLVSCNLTKIEKPELKENNKFAYKLKDLEKITDKLKETKTKSIKSNFNYTKQASFMGFDIKATDNIEAHIIGDDFSIKYNKITSTNDANSNDTSKIYKQLDNYYMDAKDPDSDKKDKDNSKFLLTKEQYDTIFPDLFLPTYNPYSLITNKLLINLDTIKYEGLEIYRTFIDYKISITINKESFNENKDLLTPILTNSFNIKDETLNIMNVINEGNDFTFNTIIVIKDNQVIQYTNSLEYETIGLEYSIKSIISNTVNYSYSTIKYPNFKDFKPFGE